MGRKDREHDLDDELRSFVEMAADDGQLAGKSREDARRAAVLELRGVEQSKERVRAAWPGHALLEFVGDIRVAVRGLIRRPLFTAVIVFTLALAFGINASIYSLVDTILLRTPAGIRSIGWGHNTKDERTQSQRENKANDVHSLTSLVVD